MKKGRRLSAKKGAKKSAKIIVKKRARRSKEMRNISRVDYERRRMYGWLVRVMREGVTHQKFFSDSVFGGKRASLHAARRHRDEMLVAYPAPPRGNMFNRKTARNTSGHAGVSRTRSKRKGRYYDVWQAGWVLPDGKHVTRKFGFSEGGRSELQAKRLAIKARREALAAMEAN